MPLLLTTMLDMDGNPEIICLRWLCRTIRIFIFSVATHGHITSYNIRSWLNLTIFCNLWFTWPWQKSILQQLLRSSKMLPVSSFFTSIYNHFIIFHKRALLDDNYYTRWATTLILREAHILCTEILFVTWQESFVAWSSFRLRSSRQR
jgi:hypothetical protein